jgi:hypothetical protein
VKAKTWILLIGLVSTTGKAQKASVGPTDKILIDATVAAQTLEEALSIHFTSDPHFSPTKQNPEDKRTLPQMLFTKDNGLQFDWTPGQHARYLMEELRQGIYQLQSAQNPLGLDSIALAGARESWPKLRGISCQDKPGTRFFDLNGVEQYCPESHRTNSR